MTRRIFGSAVAIAGLVGVMACSQGSKATSSSLTAPTPESVAERGNGTPSGAKLVFKWNLIGTPGDYEGGCGNGSRIFVERGASNAHILIQDDNDGWHIVECDATGGDQAVLHSDDLGTFDVYVRILGKIGGKLDVCANPVTTLDPDGPICLLGTISLTRDNGQSKFNFKPDALFDASLEDIIWSVDTNADFRIAQFRVYQVS